MSPPTPYNDPKVLDTGISDWFGDSSSDDDDFPEETPWQEIDLNWTPESLRCDEVLQPMESSGDEEWYTDPSNLVFISDLQRQITDIQITLAQMEDIWSANYLDLLTRLQSLENFTLDKLTEFETRLEELEDK